MRRLLASAAVLLALGPGPAGAWDAPFAIRPDAETSPWIALGAAATLPLEVSPAELSAVGFVLSGGVGYLDDDKAARLTVAALAANAVYREQRDRFEPSAGGRIALFELDVQLRVLPGLHLLYGAALARSGPRAHAGLAALGFHLGLALPLVGDRGSMREYRRAFLQVEARPLVGSLLGLLDLEGADDRELPRPGLGSEVALEGQVATVAGLVQGDLRLTASYLLGSVYLIATLRYLAPVLFWRLAPYAHVQYTWPARPLRLYMSEPAQRLAYDHHVDLVVGLAVGL